MGYYGEQIPDGIETDIVLDTGEKLKSDAAIQIGSEKYPVFNVSKEDFYKNMKAERNRLRFSSGSNAQKYHSGTKYRSPFYIQFSNDDGKVYQRKIR